MPKIAEHRVLIYAESYSNACKQVRHYFKKSSLVTYNYIRISCEHSWGAEQPQFQQELERGLGKNKEMITSLIQELEEGGIKSCSDLATISQGYQSKTLHLLTHLLDGFISTDSAFYNLVDDSHLLSYQRQQAIKQEPQNYWLILLDGYAESPEKSSILTPR